MSALALTGDPVTVMEQVASSAQRGTRPLLGLEHRDARVSIDQRQQPPADLVQPAGRHRRPAGRARAVRHDESVAGRQQGRRRAERSAATGQLGYLDRRSDERRQHAIHLRSRLRWTAGVVAGRPLHRVDVRSQQARWGIYRKAADGSGSDELLVCAEGPHQSDRLDAQRLPHFHDGRRRPGAAGRGRRHRKAHADSRHPVAGAGARRLRVSRQPLDRLHVERDRPRRDLRAAVLRRRQQGVGEMDGVERHAGAWRAGAATARS